MYKIPVRHIKDSSFEDRFSIRNIEPLVIDRDLLHELHRHDFYFILFIKSGNGLHAIDFTKYKVENNSVFFIQPGQVHELKLEKGTTGYILQFTSDFYSPRENAANVVLRKVSNKNHFQLSTERFEKVYLFLQIIFNEFTLKQDRYKDFIRATLDIILIELVRQSNEQNYITNETKLYAQERLEELQDLLEKHIYTKKQVSEYAEMLNITPYQLNAVTKSLLQKTGSQLINEHIILETKRMLIATGNQVNQIADMMGFDDPSYFIRFFKKQTGYTPEAFRHNLK